MCIEHPLSLTRYLLAGGYVEIQTPNLPPGDSIRARGRVFIANLSLSAADFPTEPKGQELLFPAPEPELKEIPKEMCIT